MTPVSVVAGRDPNGNVILAGLLDTGLRDGQGQKLYAPMTAHGAQTVSPDNQTTTNAFADVAGSTIDSLNNVVVSYTLLNLDGANGISWQVLASNDAGFAASVTVQSSANIAAGAVGTFTTNPALYRYYKVQVKDQVNGSHAAAQVRGIARG